MNIDLDQMSRKDLEKLRADVDRALQRVGARELQAAREAVERAAREFGFSLAEVMDGSAKGKTKAKADAKYRNPADESQTWSGRGRKPQWIKDAESAGTDIASFAI